MKRIPLTQGQVALVDDCDYDFLMQWSWCAIWNRRWYSHRGQRGRTTLSMHRAIAARLGYPKNLQIDHKNRNGLDNRRCNLRPATVAENMRNRGVNQNNTSGFKGVHKDRNGKWMARIGVDYRRIYLGSFSTPIEAAQIYNKAAIKYFGEFAWLNTIEEV